MRLQDLHLLQFKNYEEAALQFSPHINCFTGPNGSGKTNLLDAIHYLCMTRSAFTGNDQQNIRRGEEYFMVRGTFEKRSGMAVLRSATDEMVNESEEYKSAEESEDDLTILSEPAAPGFDAMGDENDDSNNQQSTTNNQQKTTHPLIHSSTHLINCTVRANQKKVITRNRVPYEKMSEHIGKYPVVMITPFDTDLIREGSEERRKFFDSLLSQIDAAYLQDLIVYTQLLRQRNLLLKQFADRNQTDLVLLEILDEQLLAPGTRIAASRHAFMSRFEPVFRRHYQFLADGSEAVELTYKSHLTENNFADLLKQAQRKDLIMQRSTAGPHKDDYVFSLGQFPVKNYGSQGQQKSFVIALKLAQFEIIAQEKGFKPLLLLDDIFDRLDEQRIKRLLQLVAAHTFGQLFITDSHPNRTLQLLQNVAEDMRWFTVKEGVARVAE